MAKRNFFLDYGELIVNYNFNKDTLFRVHNLALKYINSNGNKINLEQLAKAHNKTIQKYLKARENQEWTMNKIMFLMSSSLNLNIKIDELEEIYKLSDHDSIPFPESYDVLPELRKKGKLGIISNLPHDSLIYELKRDNLYNLFDTITISCEVGYRKPHPKIYLGALKKANAKPEESIFISHDKEEVVGAEKVGMRGILVKSLSEVIGAL